MIQTKDDLKRYLEKDAIAMSKTGKSPKLIGDRIWKYEILYRKYEYYFNNRHKNIVYKMCAAVYGTRFKLWSSKWGNEFPLNCIEEGLVIWHGQNIIINGNARIGKNFSISTGCIVGHAHNEYPTIGDDVKLSVDCKVLGGIYVANHVTIGAGAVVVKNIDQPYSTWGGCLQNCCVA